eukprot:Hpha_TRINITY_DN14472_c0_g1::TRINITY_DN14472_c0_g1_i2::g.157707::m.157707
MPGSRRPSSRNGPKGGSTASGTGSAAASASEKRRKSRQASKVDSPSPVSKFQTISEIPDVPVPQPGSAPAQSTPAPTSPARTGVVSIVDPQQEGTAPQKSVGGGTPASEAGAPAAAAGEGGEGQQGQGQKRESFAALRERQLREQFDEMDLDGDGFLSDSELKISLSEMGVQQVTDTDLRRFLGGESGSKITFEEFRDKKVSKQMKELRRVKAAEDCASHAASSGGRTLMPTSIMRRVIEFCGEVQPLRTLCCTSRTWREYAAHDEVWKPLLVRRRRMEQGKSASKANALPEIRITSKGGTDAYFKWYLAWVRESAAERGNSAQLKRLKDEMDNNGEAIGVPTETVLCALTPLVYPPVVPDVPEGAEADLVDTTPKPPPLPDVLTGDEKGFVQLRKLAKPQEVVANLSEHDSVIECITVSDSFIYCASQDCTVTVWPRDNLSRPQFTMTAHKEAVSAVELAPWDERTCVTGSMDRTAIIWNRVEMPARPRKGQKEGFALQITPKRILDKGHTMKITAIILRMQVIFTASRDCLVILWDWSGKVMNKIEQHMGPVNCLCIAHVPPPPDEDEEEEPKKPASPSMQGGRRATTGAAGSGDIGLRAPRTTRSPSAAVPNLAAGSPLSGARAIKEAQEDDGTIIASACGGGLVKGWSLRGKQQYTRRLHESPIELLVPCRDLGVLASGSWDSTVALFNPTTGNMPCVFKGHDGVIRSLVVDEKRRRMISASDDKLIIIWDFVHIDLDCSRDLERTVLSPHLTLRGPKTPIVNCSLVCMHDSRWHSLVAVAKSATLFLWRFNDQAQFQTRGMKLVTPKD